MVILVIAFLVLALAASASGRRGRCPECKGDDPNRECIVCRTKFRYEIV